MSFLLIPKSPKVWKKSEAIGPGTLNFITAEALLAKKQPLKASEVYSDDDEDDDAEDEEETKQEEEKKPKRSSSISGSESSSSSSQSSDSERSE